MKAMLFLSFPAFALLVGCASVSDRPLERVNEQVGQKEAQAVRAIRSDEDLVEVERQVHSLLATNLTLDAAIKIALLNNRELHERLEEVGVAEAGVIQAGLLRNIELAGSWRFPNEPTPYDNVEYGASGNILDVFMLPFRKKIAARNLETAEYRAAAEILGLVGDIRNAFSRVQADQELLTRLGTQVELSELALDLAKRQKEAGNITDLQFATHQGIYAQSRLAVAQATSDLRRDREALNRLLGLWGEMTAWEVAEALPAIPGEERPLENLEGMAMTNRLDLVNARRSMENAEYALRLRSKTRFLPTALHVGASTEREPHGERLTGPEIELELPIFDQGQGEIARLGALYRQAQRRFEALAINARSEVREARDRLVASRELAQFYEQVVLPQQREVVRQTLLQYNAMQVGTFDLINAKERELASERNYIEAWRNYWQARSDLERALTGGTASSSLPSGTSLITNTATATSTDNH